MKNASFGYGRGAGLLRPFSKRKNSGYNRPSKLHRRLQRKLPRLRHPDVVWHLQQRIGAQVADAERAVAVVDRFVAVEQVGNVELIAQVEPAGEPVPVRGVR